MRLSVITLLAEQGVATDDFTVIHKWSLNQVLDRIRKLEDAGKVFVFPDSMDPTQFRVFPRKSFDSSILQEPHVWIDGLTEQQNQFLRMTPCRTYQAQIEFGLSDKRVSAIGSSLKKEGLLDTIADAKGLRYARPRVWHRTEKALVLNDLSRYPDLRVEVPYAKDFGKSAQKRAKRRKREAWDEGI
jgi:hypothetical protein